jgi:hypothetical protein
MLLSIIWVGNGAAGCFWLRVLLDNMRDLTSFLARKKLRGMKGSRSCQLWACLLSLVSDCA